MADSVQYYSDNAEDFFKRTAVLDVSQLYEMFLPRLPEGGRILDAGCGSGRDALAFTEMGYEIEAIDACPELVEQARVHSGLDVKLLRFEDMDYGNEFDGIWSCASLLHVSRDNTPRVFAGFVQALRPGGVWYLSYKYGEGDVERGGRLFSNHTEESLREILGRFQELSIEDVRVSSDVRTQRDDDRWINLIAVKARG